MRAAIFYILLALVTAGLYMLAHEEHREGVGAFEPPAKGKTHD
jgi:hypothetical protein